MRRSYVVEVLFTLILFTVFVLGSFFILLFGAQGYRTLVENQNHQEELRLTLSYLSTRVQQAPSASAIAMEEIENIPCLMIEEQLEGVTYVTVIFYQDHSLWELFVRKDRMDLSMATAIASIENLTMQESQGQLIFIATNQNQEQQTLILNPR